MSYRVDYNEPIPKLIERLEREHRELDSKLARVLELSESGNLRVAESTLLSISQEILRHEVEEEARIIRAIADNSRDDLERSAEVTQYHRRVDEFLKEKLPHLSELPPSRAKQEIKDFVLELKKHHKEEEEITFPIALRAAK
jgi:hypothetical protein